MIIEDGRRLREEHLTMFVNEQDAKDRFERYCDECKGKPLIDQETGLISLDNYGRPIFVGSKVPTVSGLALALGFVNRQNMLRYSKNGEYKTLIQAMLTKMEEYAEQRLYDRNGQKGAIFSLCNSFNGWSQMDKNDDINESLDKLDAILEATKKNAIDNGTNKIMIGNKELIIDVEEDELIKEDEEKEKREDKINKADIENSFVGR